MHLQRGEGLWLFGSGRWKRGRCLGAEWRLRQADLPCGCPSASAAPCCPSWYRGESRHFSGHVTCTEPLEACRAPPSLPLHATFSSQGSKWHSGRCHPGWTYLDGAWPPGFLNLLLPLWACPPAQWDCWPLVLTAHSTLQLPSRRHSVPGQSCMGCGSRSEPPGLGKPEHHPEML